MTFAHLPYSELRNFSPASGVVPFGSTPTLARAAISSGFFQNLLKFAVEFGQHVGGEALRREDSEPEIDFEALEAGLVHRGLIRIDRRPFGAGGGDGAHAIVGGEWQRASDAGERELDLIRHHVGIRRADAAIGHMRRLDAGALHEQFGTQMRRGADTGGGEVHFARVGLAVGDQLRDVLHRKLRRDHQHLRRRADDGNCLQLLEQVVGHARLQGRIDHDRRVHQHERVAVWRRARDGVGAADAAGAGPVLGDHRLADRIAEMLGDLPADVIDDPARRIGQHQLDRLGRESLRRRACRQREQQGGGKQHAVRRLVGIGVFIRILQFFRISLWNPSSKTCAVSAEQGLGRRP